MKVLLFVQNDGDKRPKCVPCSYRDAFLFRTDPMFRKVVPYDRWWLVECENAEAGRRVIYHFDRDCVEFPKEAFTSPFRYAEGIVLSYGGKR